MSNDARHAMKILIAGVKRARSSVLGTCRDRAQPGAVRRKYVASLQESVNWFTVSKTACTAEKFQLDENGKYFSGV
jgi:hypothetical protein